MKIRANKSNRIKGNGCDSELINRRWYVIKLLWYMCLDIPLITLHPQCNIWYENLNIRILIYNVNIHFGVERWSSDKKETRLFERKICRLLFGCCQYLILSEWNASKICYDIHTCKYSCDTRIYPLIIIDTDDYIQINFNNWHSINM